MPELSNDGVTIHYQVYGPPTDRAPLLLTHGYSASTAMWAPNVTALSAERQVIAWDIRGHGASASPSDPSRYSEAASVSDMAAVLDACSVERAAIGGLSLGGYLSLSFHLAHRERVSSLLLFDTGPGFKRDEARNGWNDQAEATAAAFESSGLDALSAGAEVATASHDPRGLALAARGILTQHDATVISSLPTIAVPTLVLVGEQDKPFRNAADYMVAKIPNAVEVVIPGAGHASNIDQPTRFNEAVIDFMGPD